MLLPKLVFSVNFDSALRSHLILSALQNPYLDGCFHSHHSELHVQAFLFPPHFSVTIDLGWTGWKGDSLFLTLFSWPRVLVYLSYDKSSVIIKAASALLLLENRWPEWYSLHIWCLPLEILCRSSSSADYHLLPDSHKADGCGTAA